MAGGLLYSSALLLVTSTALLTQVNQITAAVIDGLYVTNGTDVLKVNIGSPTVVRSLYKTTGRIVGLGYSSDQSLIFWSDIGLGSRGIYRGTTDVAGNINNVTVVVSDDVLEVNVISVNWVSGLIYWTDSRKRTIEVAKFDGSSRRILISGGLSQPRGIVADPVNGYLFWNDQGYHQIERSQLDGSSRQIIVANGTNSSYWPNQMVVKDSKLYWIDSSSKTLRRSNLDGSSATLVASLATESAGSHVFGLTIYQNTAYITCWSSVVQLISVDLTLNSVTRITVNLGTGSVFSAIYAHTSTQPTGINNPCPTATCPSGLCLPVSTTTSRCTCPSFGGKSLYGSNCQEPSKIVVYALADSGFVGFYDPDASNTAGDQYFVGRSSRPVAVAYDPTVKMVYWSDVRERVIYRAFLNGTGKTIFVDGSQGVGIVDGMVLDAASRQLFYTNIGSMTVEETTYSWHKVETVNIDGFVRKVRTIVSSFADKPRAIALDSTNGALYYTDWGTKASVVKTNLDGSYARVIKTGLNNPNGLAIVQNKLYIVDSNFKNRVLGLSPANGVIQSANMDGSSWADVAVPGLQLQLPFGLTTDGASVYVSDWETQSIQKIDITTKAKSTIVSGIVSPMAVYYSPVSTPVSPGRSCSPACGDICLAKDQSNAVCACSSYKAKSQDKSSTTTCALPSDYLLVADMDGVKMVSLSGGTDQSVYVAAPGRPFTSNIVALAYDATSRIAYYSDVSSKAINVLFLQNSSTTEFYRVNHVIDGLTLYGNILYWTDSANGLIASLDVGLNSTQRRHTILRAGLNKPRAIKIDSTSPGNSYIIWTEWGSNPRVSRMNLDGTNVQIFDSISVKWPNGLFIDSANSKLYIADGHPTGRQLLSCSLAGTGCTQVAGVNSNTVAHMYDIYVSNGNLFYSDWKNRSINVVPLTAGGSVVQPLAIGLMRPSQFQFVITTSASNCTTPVGCDSCVRASTSPQGICSCNAGKTYVTDANATGSCASTAGLTCTYPGKSALPVGATYNPSPCKNCQCLANRFYASAATDGGFTCDTIDCPPLPDNCPSRVTPNGACCPVCTNDPDYVCSSSTGIVITNCPKSAVSVSLPEDSSGVIYQFLPTVRDCLHLSRDVVSTKTPIGDVYAWTGSPYSITVTSTARKPDSSAADITTCSFALNVVDVTPPTLTCPANVVQWTTGSSTSVQYPPPAAHDNVGLKAPASCSPRWGTAFNRGTTAVTCSVSDKSGLTSTCSFNVIVNEQSSTGGSGTCPVPKLTRGHFDCSTQSSAFVCIVVCDQGFTYQNTIPSSNSISCANGQWDKNLPDTFERFTCLRKISGTLSGNIGVAVPNVCGLAVQKSYTETALKNRIDTNYLSYATMPLNSVVKVTGCGSAARRKRDATTDQLIVQVIISGDYSSTVEKQTVQVEIDYVLRRIEEDLSKGFLVIPLRNESGIWTAVILSTPPPQLAMQDSTCPSGSYKAIDGNCLFCPSGTYQSGSQCINCSADTFNDQDGQTQCTQCPAETPVSQPGSYIVDECTGRRPSDKDNNVPVIVGVVVGVGGGLILIAIIIIVVVCVRKRRGKEPESQAGRSTTQKYDNGLYPADEGFYNSIPENFDKVGTGPSVTNGGASAAPNEYEAIDKNVEAVADEHTYMKPVIPES